MTNNPVDTAIAFALAQRGEPYQWGATGPDKWDCSGLTQAAYKAAGINIPRVTGQQVGTGKRIAPGQQKPGDLIFPYAGHVQMYIGGGQIVEAPKTGLNVRVTKIGNIWQVRRIVEVDGTKAAYGGDSIATKITGNDTKSIQDKAAADINASDHEISLNPFGWVDDFIGWLKSIGMRFVYVLSGLALLWLGLRILIMNSSAGDAIKNVALSAATKGAV